MVSFVYGDWCICNALAKMFLLSVSVIAKPNITAVSKFYFNPGLTFGSGKLLFYHKLTHVLSHVIASQLPWSGKFY